MAEDQEMDIAQEKKAESSSFEDAMLAFDTKKRAGPKTSSRLKKKFKLSVKKIMAVKRFAMGAKKPVLDSVTLAYPGGTGSFANLAAKDYFNQCKGVDYRGATNFKNVFTMVESEEVQYGIIPVENSRSGVLSMTLDLLINHKVSIVGETSYDDGHFLCALPGVAKKDIKKVYSHPHILSQCEKFLASLNDDNNGIDRVCTVSSSAGVAMIKTDQSKTAAAVASKEAAEHGGLVVIEESIADYYPIATRYIVLAKNPVTFSNTRDLKLKSTICLQCLNQTGSLFKILSCFALRGVEVTSLHSRPASTSPNKEDVRHWDLIFYLDYVPSLDEEINKSLMTNVREYSANVMELGTYEQNSYNTKVEDWYSCKTITDCVYY